MFSTAEPFAKILEGSSAESPYASFFSNNKSLTAFAVLNILMAESFIVLLLCAVTVAVAFVNLLNCAQTYRARVLGFCFHYMYLDVNVRIGLVYMQINTLIFWFSCQLTGLSFGWLGQAMG